MNSATPMTRHFERENGGATFVIYQLSHYKTCFATSHQPKKLMPFSGLVTTAPTMIGAIQMKKSITTTGLLLMKLRLLSLAKTFLFILLWVIMILGL
jgi:hypothetical protein